MDKLMNEMKRTSFELIPFRKSKRFSELHCPMKFMRLNVRVRWKVHHQQLPRNKTFASINWLVNQNAAWPINLNHTENEWVG